MLHIINSSPAQTSALRSCLLRLMPDSALLLIENGVYAAIKSDDNSEIWTGLPDNVKLYVLESDLDARGISADEIDARFTSTDYSGFVDLVERYPAVQSWV